MEIPAGTPLAFFLDDNATGNNEYFPSRVALVGLFDNALTSGEITRLYHGGSPINPGSRRGNRSSRAFNGRAAAHGLSLAIFRYRRPAR